MSNYEKYLKYKKKYLDTKNKQYSNQRGGNNLVEFTLFDEIHFRGRQMMEHLLFLNWGLDINKAEKLKKKSMELHMKWKSFLEKTFYSKGIRVTLKTVFLTVDDMAKLGSDVPIDEVNKLIDETKKFKEKLIDDYLSKGNEWIGLVYLSLAKHMLEETIYFKRKINGPLFAPEEEISYINEHHSGEMAVTAQLIDPDPSQQKIIDLVRSYAAT